MTASATAKIWTGYLMSKILNCDYPPNQLNNDDSTSFLVLWMTGLYRQQRHAKMMWLLARINKNGITCTKLHL